MHWTEPATSDDSHAELEKKLWDAANQLWAGASLKPSEYSPTVLGLIFLRYADVRFAAVEQELGRDVRPAGPTSRRRRTIGPTDYHAAGVVYLPDEALFSHLLSLPEGANVGQAVNEAMRAIEMENPDLADVLPKSYHILESRTLASLLKTMASISVAIPIRNLPRHSAPIRNLSRRSETKPGGQERVADTARLARRPSSFDQDATPPIRLLHSLEQTRPKRKDNLIRPSA